MAGRLSFDMNEEACVYHVKDKHRDRKRIKKFLCGMDSLNKTTNVSEKVIDGFIEMDIDIEVENGRVTPITADEYIEDIAAMDDRFEVLYWLIIIGGDANRWRELRRECMNHYNKVKVCNKMVNEYEYGFTIIESDDDEQGISGGWPKTSSSYRKDRWELQNILTKERPGLTALFIFMMRLAGDYY